MPNKEDREDQWISKSVTDRGYMVLDFPFLLRAAAQAAEAAAERREAQEIGLTELLDKFPETDPDAEAAKQKLLSEIRRQAPLLPPRGRNWVCGYLRSNFSELAACLALQIDSHDDAAWGAKIEEIIKASLAEPSWPILLGRFYAAAVQMAEATRNDIR